MGQSKDSGAEASDSAGQTTNNNLQERNGAGGKNNGNPNRSGGGSETDDGPGPQDRGIDRKTPIGPNIPLTSTPPFMPNPVVNRAQTSEQAWEQTPIAPQVETLMDDDASDEEKAVAGAVLVVEVLTMGSSVTGGGVGPTVRTISKKIGGAVADDAARMAAHAPVCFAEGTFVATEDGAVPIEEIEVGTLVWAFNMSARKPVLGRVQAVLRGETSRWIEIAFGEDVVRATPWHPFWNRDAEKWVYAEELTVGTHLLSVTGRELTVTNVRVEDIDVPEPTFNLTVANDANYFVGEERALVHNEPTPPQLPGRVLHNGGGIRVVHNYGNVGRGIGTAVEHAPIHFHVSFQGKEYKVFASGQPLRSSAAPPKAVQDVFNKHKSKFRMQRSALGSGLDSFQKDVGDGLDSH